MPCTKAPCLKHRPTTFGLHTATKTVDASATTDFRLIGSLWHLLSPTATEPRKGPAPLGSDCWLSEREDYTVLAHHGQISQVVIRRSSALPSGHMPAHACRPARRATTWRQENTNATLAVRRCNHHARPSNPERLALQQERRRGQGPFLVSAVGSILIRSAESLGEQESQRWGAATGSRCSRARCVRPEPAACPQIAHNPGQSDALR